MGDATDPADRVITRSISPFPSRLRTFAFQFFRIHHAADQADAPRLPCLHTWPAVYAVVVSTLVAYVVGLALLSGLGR